MKRFLTLMAIPHNDDHVREFNLGTPLLWCAATLLVLFICTAFYFTYGYYARRGAELAYAGLKVENQELGSHLSELRSRMTGLSSRVSDLAMADTRMRTFARMTDPTADQHDEPLASGYDQNDDPYALTNDGYGSLDQLTRDANRLVDGYENLLNALHESGDTRRHIPSVFPVRGDGWYSSNFGYRTDPITGQRSFNNGIDIAGRKGTPIVATADGRVDAARSHNRLGSMVSIDHGHGLRTVYAHLEGHRLVKPGQHVSRGDIIGKMSDTGRTTAVHLHYAVICDNKAQDPLNYILGNRQRRSLF